MFSRRSGAASARAASLVLAAALAVAAPLALAATPREPLDPPASAAKAPAVEPAMAAPAATVPATPAPPTASVASPAAEKFGPQKPSVNSAIRAALIRAEAAAKQSGPEVHAQWKAVNAFYASRGDAPVWIAQGHWTPQAQGAFERLLAAPEDGLDLRAWRVYSLDTGPEASMALGDVALSQAVAAYAFQASGGRIDPSRISKLIGAHPAVIAAAQALDETAHAVDADAQLQSYNPVHPGYLALKAQLAESREEPADGRFSTHEDNRRASDAVATIRASAQAAARKTALQSELLVNMEFWRWLPRDMGADRIVVNIPEFMGRLYRADSETYSFRVIVGKPDKGTPLFSRRMDHLIVNPSWYVPQSIIKNEMMSKLGALQAQGYEINYDDGRLTIRQPPGERNALGRIKFIFPNEYAVYMHDTPTRNLFSATRRAFSHGCVRVDQPFKLAVNLLRPDRGWSEQRLKKLIGPNERTVQLPEPMPVHLTYFTAEIDESGQLRRFDDIYGYSAKAKTLLGLGG